MHYCPTSFRIPHPNPETRIPGTCAAIFWLHTRNHRHGAGPTLTLFAPSGVARPCFDHGRRRESPRAVPCCGRHHQLHRKLRKGHSCALPRAPPRQACLLAARWPAHCPGAGDEISPDLEPGTSLFLLFPCRRSHALWFTRGSGSYTLPTRGSGS